MIRISSAGSAEEMLRETESSKVIADLQSRLERSEEVREEMRDALKPFANFACDESHVNEPDCFNCKAKKALSSSGSSILEKIRKLEEENENLKRVLYPTTTEGFKSTTGSAGSKGTP